MCCSWHQSSRSWPGFKPDLYGPADHCQTSFLLLPPHQKNSPWHRRAACGRAAALLRSTDMQQWFTLWWPQIETGGFRYQQIELQSSQSKVTFPAWNPDQLRSIFPLSRESSSLSSRTFFGDQFTFLPSFFGVVDFTCFTWRRHKHGEIYLFICFGHVGGSEPRRIFILVIRAALTGVLIRCSLLTMDDWENAPVFTWAGNLCGSSSERPE